MGARVAGKHIRATDVRSRARARAMARRKALAAFFAVVLCFSQLGTFPAATFAEGELAAPAAVADLAATENEQPAAGEEPTAVDDGQPVETGYDDRQDEPDEGGDPASADAGEEPADDDGSGADGGDEPTEPAEGDQPEGESAGDDSETPAADEGQDAPEVEDPADDGDGSGKPSADDGDGSESEAADGPDAPAADDAEDADSSDGAAARKEAKKEAVKEDVKQKLEATKIPALLEAALAPMAEGDVLTIMADEGVRLKFHVTGPRTVEFGLGHRATQDEQAVDYQYRGSITIPETITVEGVTYDVVGIGDYALAPYPKGLSEVPCNVTRVYLPSTAGYIGANAFERTSIRSMFIPASVARIGSSAFENSSLSTVTFEEGTGITTLPDRCFFGTSLRDISFIPQSVTMLGGYAFSRSALTDAVIPATITRMGNGVFARCESLRHAEFAGTVPGNEIPAYTFSECIVLGSFDFEACGARSVEAYAFYGSGLTEVSIPKALTYLGEYAFSGCTTLAQAEFESGHGILTLNEGLFSGCSQLRSFTMPAKVRTISSKVFSGCKRIKTMDFPASLRSIGSFAFEDCGALETITFLGNASNVTCETSAFYLANNLKSVVFMDKKATTLTYPSAVPTVYYTLSYYLSRAAVGKSTPYATFIVAANSVPESAPSGKIYAGELLEATPAGGAWAYESGFAIDKEMTDSFYAYAAAATATLKVGDTFVADTIEGVPVTYTVKGKASGSKPGRVTVGYSTDAGYQNAIDPATTGAVTIPDRVVGTDGNTYTVESIEPNAFLNCRSIVSLTVPATVTSIGEHAFTRCSTLRNVYFESDANTIRDAGIFSGCGNIKRVIFGGKKANVSFGTSSPDVYYTVRFYETKHDLQIEHPQSVLVAHERSLLGNLKASQIYSGTIPALKTGYDWVYEQGFGPDIPLADSCEVYAAGIGFQVEIDVRKGNVSTTPCWFRMLTLDEDTKTGTCMVGLGKDGISAIHTGVSGTPVIPSEVTDEDGNTYTVTAVGDYAFGSPLPWQACHYITSASLPKTITSIGVSAFENCQLMKTIEVPEAVETLGEAAFAGCEALTSVTFGSRSALTAIPARAFKGDINLVAAMIPSRVTTIGDEAYRGCYYYDRSTRTATGLRTVQFPSALVSIGEMAFYDDGLINSLEFPTHVSSIGDAAFFMCHNIGTIRFNGNASGLSVGHLAFDLRRGQWDSQLKALIFMDKKDADLADQIFIASAKGDPAVFDTYYCIRYYGSQGEYDMGTPMSRLIILDDLAAVNWTEGVYSGYRPTLPYGSAWRCESGFGDAVRTQDSYYAVMGYDISLAEVTFDRTDWYYTAHDITPEPIVTWIDGTRLIEGVEYVLDPTKGSKHDGYTNNRRGPVAYANIVGVGDYAGTARGAFNISLQMDTSQSFDVQFPQAMLYVYDGQPKTPAVTVTATLAGDPYNVVEGVDYEVSYEDNVNAGTGHVVVTGKGIYGGRYVKGFAIVPMSIYKCTLSGMKTTYSLTEGFATPKVTLVNPQGVTLVEGKDYTLSFSNNTSAGVGTVRIVGCGNYTGVLAKTFTVSGKGGGGQGGEGGGDNPGGGGQGDNSGGGGTNNDSDKTGGGKIVVVAQTGADEAHPNDSDNGGNAAAAAAISDGGGGDGGSSWNIYRMGVDADIEVMVEENWWWVLLLILLGGALIAGMIDRKRRFDEQLH